MSTPLSHDAAGTNYRPLVGVLAAACIGIVVDRLLSWSIAWWWPLALASWIAWWWLWRSSRLRTAAVALLVSVAATSAGWHHQRWSLFEHDHVGRFASPDAEPVAIRARATSGPRRIPAPPPDPLRTVATPERTRLDVELVAIRDGERWRNLTGSAAVIVDGHVVDVLPGDTLQVFAQLGSMREPDNPGEFDFAAQARSGRRLCWLRCEFPECITSAGGGWTTGLTGLVDVLRSRGDALLWRNLGAGRSALAAAMFLGARDELDPDLRQAFIETGTIHLLVVSGLNVGILASCLFFVMRVGLVPRGWALAIVATACVLYAAVTDGEPPVVRATVMVLVACLAMVLARRPLGFNTLAAAGLVVLAINPAELFQAGTQLSFLSVGVLVFIADSRIGQRPLDPLDRLIARTRRWPFRVARRLRESAWQATLATTLIWVVICPLVMARFHLVSPVAVLLGPLLAVPVMLAMASGFGIFLFGWLVPPLGSLLGAICSGSLALMQGCVESARDWPASHFWVSGPSNWWLLGFYATLATWALVPRWRPAPLDAGTGGRLVGVGVGRLRGRSAKRRSPAVHVSVGWPRHGGSPRTARRRDPAL